jgi:hypothetical protein
MKTNVIVPRLEKWVNVGYVLTDLSLERDAGRLLSGVKQTSFECVGCRSPFSPLCMS